MSSESTHNLELSIIVQNSLLESSILQRLSMTIEERIEAHENARQLMVDLQKAVSESRHAKPEVPVRKTLKE